MLKSQIKVGGVYLVKVSDRVVPCRVDAIDQAATTKGGSVQLYCVTNLATNRKTIFRSAAKFRGEAGPDAPAYKPQPKTDSGQFGARDRDAEEAGYSSKLIQPVTDAEVDAAAKLIEQAETKVMDGAMRRKVAETIDKEEARLIATPPALPQSKLFTAAPVDAAPHLIVDAKAGTGKTTTLVEGLRELFGTPSKLTPSPQQRAIWDAIGLSKGKIKTACFVAFNKAIADELKLRVPAGAEAMTMHSMGFRAVRRAFPKVDAGDKGKRLVGDLLAKLLGQDFWDLRRARPVLVNAVEALVDLCKMNLAEPTRENLIELADRHDIDLDPTREAYGLVPEVLDRCKDVARNGCLAFADMIWLPVVLGLPVFRYDLLLVDEAQDLNRCQQALAKMAGRRLVLCGDPRQAIYGFAGADAESMPRMASELGDTFLTAEQTGSNGSAAVMKPGRGCMTLPLTVTRRCGKAIVDEARKIVPAFEAHASNPQGKISQATFKETRGPKWVEERNDGSVYDQSDEMVTTPCYRAEVRDGDFVLCRKNAPLVSECFKFLAEGRKTNIQGRDIGVGLVKTIRKLCKDDATPVAALIEKLSAWAEGECAKEKAKKTPSDARLQAIEDRHECLLCFAAGHEIKMVGDVVRRIDAIFTDQKDSPGVKLSSIHKSKGLEAKRVFLLDIKEAAMPLGKMQIWEREQETNLRYVAITRAIEELIYVH